MGMFICQTDLYIVNTIEKYLANIKKNKINNLHFKIYLMNLRSIKLGNINYCKSNKLILKTAKQK